MERGSTADFTEPRPGLDAFTEQHLATWAGRALFDDEREEAVAMIRDFVIRHSDVLKTHSWPIILTLARREAGCS